MSNLAAGLVYAPALGCLSPEAITIVTMQYFRKGRVRKAQNCSGVAPGDYQCAVKGGRVYTRPRRKTCQNCFTRSGNIKPSSQFAYVVRLNKQGLRLHPNNRY